MDKRQQWFGLLGSIAYGLAFIYLEELLPLGAWLGDPRNTLIHRREATTLEKVTGE